jgi:hypothetical protein
LGKILEEITDDDCTLLLCGLICEPCLIAQALEEAHEANWWWTCCTVSIAPNLFGLPYLFWTIPAINRLNEKLGGDSLTVKSFLFLCLCRPCLACQLAKAVKQAKIEGRLNDNTNTNGAATQTVAGAPSTTIAMERL